MPSGACPRAGKTTFIKHLLGQDYPGCHIGPEPTTDRFVVVMHGPDERRTPGNTLVVTPDKPFTVGHPTPASAAFLGSGISRRLCALGKVVLKGGLH